MVEFNDRRANSEPADEDYEKPLTRTSLTEANRLFRQNGVRAVVGTDPEAADRIVRRTTKERFKSRRRLAGDFDTVGEYLEWLNEQTGR